MRIYIETKRGKDLDSGQIRRHFKSIARNTFGDRRADTTILIGLTKEPIADSDRKALAADAKLLDIAFAAVTFSQIVEELRGQCAAFDRELLSIVEDYESYLAEEGLLAERNRWLMVVPCGISIAENARFGVYYEPANKRRSRNCRFIGVYHLKAVQYAGTIEAIAVASSNGGVLSFTEEVGRIEDRHRERIESIIEAASYYDLRSNPTRFFVVDSFVPTNFRKTSPGGIFGLRYLDLPKIIPAYDPRRDYTSEEIAIALTGATWE